MWFNIGIGELLLIASTLVLTGVLASRRHWAWRWMLVASTSFGIAAVVTSADPFSSMLLGLALFLFFLLGVRFGRAAESSAA